ncbi:hypothetical protein M0804_005977 [Polistes exclamans]|nr:hypothetical protein M0804_005977 [Polistes exclamans]
MAPNDLWIAERETGKQKGTLVDDEDDDDDDDDGNDDDDDDDENDAKKEKHQRGNVVRPVEVCHRGTLHYTIKWAPEIEEVPNFTFNV